LVTPTSRIQLRHLSCFVAIARERTLARAAQELHLSQPAVSKTLAELEELAGRRLVDRGRSGAQLTPAGEHFLRYAVDVMRALDSAGAALTGSGPASVPTVRIGALHTVAAGPLAPAIARLRRQRPHAGVHVRTSDNPELLAALRAGEIDFAVGRMAEPSAMAGLSFELLYGESLAVVARPGHPLLAFGSPSRVPPSDLLAYPLVIPAPGTVPRHDAEGLFEAHGITLPPGGTQTQSASLSRALALVSDAIWITSHSAVQLDLDHGWLRRLGVPVPGGAEPVGLLRRSGADTSELAAALMEILREVS
jgi:DNA-binding transcriptional LysR family regulator